MNIELLCEDTNADAGNIKIILKDYSDMVYRLALSQLKNKTDAEDIFQEVFIKYIKSDKNFESGEHIKAWLIRVTVNCCKKLRKTAWFRHTVPLDECSDKIASDGEYEKSEIYYAVLELPQKYRMVIHLFYYEDMQVAEISSVLNMKQSTIVSQLRRAREILKQKLKGEYDYE